MSESNDTRLVLQALNSGKDARSRINGLVHHSDRGSPFGSDLCTDRLCALHVQPSMRESGDCWDNSVAEIFFSTLEWELLHKRSFVTHRQARRVVGEYIGPPQIWWTLRIGEFDLARRSVSLGIILGHYASIVLVEGLSARKAAD